MSCVLDRLDELRAEASITAECPRCGHVGEWWISEYSLGFTCDGYRCDFVLEFNPKPPTILCAVCGHELQRLEDIAFHCPACNRVVRP